MIDQPSLPKTTRLHFRPWQPADRPPFAALNADPEVRRHFPSVQSRAESDASADRMESYYARDGYSFLPCILTATGEFLGFVGIITGTDTPGYVGDLEIGWRLAREHWGKGYATEGARAWLRYAFEELQAPHVIAITTVGNEPSMNVMRKIGMSKVGEFGHPLIDPASPIHPHVIYRVTAEEYAERKQ